MKRVFSIAVAVAAMILPRSGQATDPFEQKLSSDRQIIQALNRLTFGPRPGDVEEVRRIGLAKWMEQQLHPDQIAENPVLEQTADAAEESARCPFPRSLRNTRLNQNMGMMMMTEPPFGVINRLPQSVRTKVMNGTAEERTAALDAMDPELRGKVLAALPDNVVEYTPKYKDEAEKARKALQDERQAQNRKRNPQLPDLLSSGRDCGCAVGREGPGDGGHCRSSIRISAWTSSRCFLRRARHSSRSTGAKAQMKRTPQLAASEDLKEARMYRAVYSNRQLEEVLVDYWFNHFNVDSTKNVGMAPEPGPSADRKL